MKYKLPILNILILLLFTSCTNQKKSQKTDANPDHQQINYKQIAYKKFGSDTIFITSSKGNFVLCKKAIEKSSLNPNILSEFFVYDIDNEKIVYEDKISGAKIAWSSNTKLLITKQKGIISSPDDTGKTIYIYNLITKKIENIPSNQSNK